MTDENSITPSGNEYAAASPYGLDKSMAEAILAASAQEDIELVRVLLSDVHEADAASFLSSIESEDRKRLVKQLGESFNPDILVELGQEVREEVMESLGTKESAAALSQLEPDDALYVIEDLDKEDQQELLEAIPQDARAALEEGLSYPDDSAGRLMQKKFVAIPEYWTVGDTIDYLRSDQEDLPEDFYEIFVVNPRFQPVGTLLLSRILRMQRAVVVREIMETQFQIVPTGMDQEEVAYLFHKYGLVSAPVVNDYSRLVGVITVDDVVEVIGEEAEEDMMRMGGVSEVDINASLIDTVKRRFPWLFVNILTATMASLVISLFEGAIAHVVALAVLMPMVASITANSGTQTSTVTIRALATKELTMLNAMRVLRKEIYLGAINGLIFGILSALLAWIRYQDVALSAVFAGAMLLTMTFSALVGSLIPLILERCKVDPAVASGVLLTGFTDTASFAIFLGLAIWFLI